MHNYETHLLQLYIFGNTYCTTFLILTYFHTPTPPSNGRQDESATSRAAVWPLLSPATSCLLLMLFSLVAFNVACLSQAKERWILLRSRTTWPQPSCHPHIQTTDEG